MSSTLQEQARALGDPTRHRIFRFIADAARPVDVAELTDHLGLNHNAIRQHLAKLTDAGLVREGRAPVEGPGRPRLRYTVDPGADGRWGLTGPYERLALWLAEMVRTGDTPVDVGKRAGRRLRLGIGPATDPVADLVEQMARHGFDPTVRRQGNQVDITLGRCPYLSTALADPDTVCQLHLGLAYGVTEDSRELVVDDLVPKDPRRAQCRLRAHLEPS